MDTYVGHYFAYYNEKGLKIQNKYTDLRQKKCETECKIKQ